MTPPPQPTDPLHRLLALPRFGAGPGLHRMAALLDALPPGRRRALPPTLTVTGSYGKGSVATLAAAALDALDLACGLYTSPHLIRAAERYQLAGVAAPAQALDAAASWALEAVDAYRARHPEDAVGVFEAATAVAFHLFAHAAPDALVAEAGLGGRLDPTRAFRGRVVGLSGLDLEHTELLGDSPLAIALDKVELVPDGGVLVLGAVETELARRLAGALALRAVRTVEAGRVARIGAVRVTAEGTSFDLELAAGPGTPELALPGLELRLAGRHQAANAAVAALLVREWLAAHHPALLDDPSRLATALRRGLATARLPCRFECLEAGGEDRPAVVADVAHTPGSIAALAATAAEALAGRRLVLLTGVSRGRDPVELLGPLLQLVSAVVVTRPAHRGEAAEGVRRAVAAVVPELPVEAVSDPGDALERARELARPHPGEATAVLVGGSLFLAAEVAVRMGGGEPGELHFV